MSYFYAAFIVAVSLKPVLKWHTRNFNVDYLNVFSFDASTVPERWKRLNEWKQSTSYLIVEKGLIQR